jgi:hypothetical protein
VGDEKFDIIFFRLPSRIVRSTKNITVGIVPLCFPEETINEDLHLLVIPTIDPPELHFDFEFIMWRESD